jgi:hypothetical protein
MTASNRERWETLSDRAAIGEPLSAVEEEFLSEHVRADVAARAEVELWESMAELGASRNDLLDHALATRAVEKVLADRRAAATRSRRYVLAGGAVSAAAVVALFVSVKAGHPSTAVGGSVVEYLGGEARSGGVRLEQGAHLAQGAIVEALSGPVCVAVESRIHTCLASGATIRLSAVGVPERRVELLAGRVATALYPLPRGERFSVMAGGVWCTAVGTAFTVELGPGGKVQTIVHEGKVAVGSERGGSVVSAHKIGLSHGEDLTVEQLVDHQMTETPEWAALASVAQRSIEAQQDVTAPSAAVMEPAKVEEATPKSAAAQPRVSSAPALVHVPLVTKESMPQAADLLALARQSLRDQRWSDAAGAYEKLIHAYPSSPEARTVVVPLAKLEIDRLGQPARALPLLEPYIASGGTLAVEARSAQIRAYQALGRSADELHAIDGFLAAHPSSLEAGKMRARADELRHH